MGVVKLRWGGRCSLYSSNTRSISFHTPHSPIYCTSSNTPHSPIYCTSSNTLYLHSHSITPSPLHTLTLSHLHSITPSHHHTLTPSPSPPHPLTPSHHHSKKQEDARQLRHISKLKKETRKKENKIQSLEADAQRKAIIMKRRADEVIITSSQNNHVYCTLIVCVYYKICVCIIMLCFGDLVGVATETEKDASFCQ